MQQQTIVGRIGECVDELGLLLDRIYRFPQKRRQLYFDRIQSMKNKLLTLKANVRQSNVGASEKQYKQIYLGVNSLKAQIMQQTNMIAVLKESKQINRPKDREGRKSHEQAMLLIVQKQSQIDQLQRIAFQKQEVVKRNEAERKRVEQERDQLIEQNRQLRQSYESLNIEFQKQRQELMGMQKSLKDREKSEAEKGQALRDAFQQIRQLKNDLTAANSRISHFEQLAEISMSKTKLVEDNLRRMQESAQDLDDSIKIKEKDMLIRVRQADELQYQLASSTERVRQLQLNNSRLLQDLQILQSQSAKLEARLQEMQSGNQLLQDRGRKLQQSNQQLQLELRISLEQKQGSYRQSQDLILCNRSLEMQVLNLKQRYVAKQEEYINIYDKLEVIHVKVRQYERMLAMRQSALQRTQKQLVQAKTRQLQLQQKCDSQNGEMELLKLRLLKAKIETLHQIRQII